MDLTIATWNINSLRLRQGLLHKLMAGLQPDVICLQETKVPDELFPEAIAGEIGFAHVLKRGMKGYNGVAILFADCVSGKYAGLVWQERLPACFRAGGNRWRADNVT